MMRFKHVKILGKLKQLENKTYFLPFCPFNCYLSALFIFRILGLFLGVTENRKVISQVTIVRVIHLFYFQLGQPI